MKSPAARWDKTRPPGSLLALIGFGLLLAVCFLAYATLWFLEYGNSADSTSIYTLWTDPRSAEFLAGTAEVTVAVLGITLTVVAILVELATRRYTSRIAQLFMRDPINSLVLGGFVVTVVLVMWVDMSLHGPHYPEVMVLVAMSALSLAVLGLLPYFGYLFGFFSPSHVISRVRRQAERAVRRAARPSASIDRCREKVIGSVEHLGDMILVAINSDESALAISSIEALSELARGQLASKPNLPTSWFGIETLAETDRDFVTLDPRMTSSVIERRTWLEAKILRGYQTAFFRGLNNTQDVNHLIAIHTQRIAREALHLGDRPALRLALRFLNTYLSRSITVGDVRSAHNVLSEFRRLSSEVLLENGEVELLEELADWLQYYARIAFEHGETFVTEAVAHDLAETIIRAHSVGADNEDALLDLLLQVDREPGGLTGQEWALSGVRKAQVKLATFYLSRGDAVRARRICDDMKHESRERLRKIHLELAELAESEWWEISSRDTNWDYLSDLEKQQLPVFFDWFEEGGLAAIPERKARL